MRFDLNQRMNWGCRQEICWEPTCKESRTRDREAKTAVGAAEVREAKSLVTLVENVRSAMEQMWTVKGRSESRLGLSPPLSLLLSLTLSGYQTQSDYFPGDSNLPSLPPSLTALLTK